MPHTELTKQAKDSIFYHNFLLAKGGFKPTNLSGLTWWLDDPAGSFNGLPNVDELANRVSANLSRDVNYLLEDDNTGTWQNMGTDSLDVFTAQGTDGFDGVKSSAPKAGCVGGTERTIGLGFVFRYEFDLVINSLDAGAVRLAIQNNPNTQSAVRTTTDSFTTSGAKEGYLVQGVSVDTGGHVAFFGVVNDLFDIEVRNFTLKKVEGNHLYQATAADQGLRTASEIEYNGGSEFSDGSARIASFNQGSGEFFIVANDLEGAGVLNIFLAFGDASTDNEHLAFGINAANKVFIEFRTGGVSNTVTFGTVTRGATTIYSFSSNGTGYKCEVNGADKATDAGTDNGDWIADNALLDTLAIAAILKTTNEFFNVGWVSGVGYNRQTIAAERANVTTFLNNRFSVF